MATRKRGNALNGGMKTNKILLDCTQNPVCPNFRSEWRACNSTQEKFDLILAKIQGISNRKNLNLQNF